MAAVQPGQGLDARGTVIAGLRRGTAADGLSAALEDLMVAHFNSEMTSDEAVRRVAEAVRRPRRASA